MPYFTKNNTATNFNFWLNFVTKKISEFSGATNNYMEMSGTYVNMC